MNHTIFTILMWVLLMAGMIAANGAGIFYLITRMNKFSIVQKLTKGNKRNGNLIGLAILIILNLVLYFTMGLWNLLTVVIHIFIAWALCDIIGFQIRKRISLPNCYIAGVAAMAVSIIWVSAGWYCCHHVFRTSYDISSNNVTSPLKIVLISDSHVGNTFHWQKFNEYIDRINAEQPDMVLIAGDFVDDDTSKEDMGKSAEALGRITAPYGVYLAYGNHDAGYYRSSHRGYSLDDVTENLTAAGVHVLQDDIMAGPANVTIVGRKDKSFPERLSIEALLAASSVPDDSYTIVLDHQPNDYAAETKANCSLVLSGHTHGGQLIPITHIGQWLGINDRTYGHEKRSDTDFIVSSGISCWAINFKTGCLSEYVVIQLHP